MNAFFFAPENPRRLALVRIGVALILLYDASLHWKGAVELYSTFGPAAPLFASQAFHAPVPGPCVAVVLQTALLFFLAAAAAGWQTRTSLWMALLLSAWLGPLDGAATFTKYSAVGLHLLLLLGVSGCGAAWSFDAGFVCGQALGARSPGAKGGDDWRIGCPVIAAWPRRLIQILVCVIYLQAILTKIASQTFASGDLLMFSLLDDDWGGGRFGLWLATLPHVPRLLSLMTMLFEGSFPFLVWVPACRRPLLAAAFAFHGAMGIAMHVGIFGPIMIVALMAFLEQRDFSAARRGLDRLRAILPRLKGPEKIGCGLLDRGELRETRGWLSPVMYVLTGALAIGGGFALQRHSDDYGVFGTRSLAPLAEVPRSELDAMLTRQLPAYADYFHRIELGSRFSGSDVFGSRHAFRQGEQAYVLCQLIQPHPKLLIEGLLIGPQGSEVARFSHRLDPSFAVAIDGFDLTGELPPGPYRILVQVNGYEIAQRRFDLNSAHQPDAQARDRGDRP